MCALNQLCLGEEAVQGNGLQKTVRVGSSDHTQVLLGLEG